MRGIKGFEDFCQMLFKSKIEVSITFKLRSFFIPFRMGRYNWIDSFLDTLEKSFFKKKKYFDTIAWNTANTIIKCSKNQL